MVEHHLQKHVIAVLVEHETARYADLKPQHIDGNVFTYHLKTLLAEKLIVKGEDGRYALTNKGKLYGINNSLTKQQLLAQPHSILLLSVQHEPNRWLLRRRLVQPLYGKVGFMHGEPFAHETIDQAADRILFKRANLHGAYTVRGSGYIQLVDDGGLVAYSHFTLVSVTALRGDLKLRDSHGENIWLDDPAFADPPMIPSMPDLVAALQQPGLFFLDKTYHL